MANTKFILANGAAIYGIGDTPESAYANGVKFGEFQPFDMLPRREQTDGSAYIGIASIALCDRAMSGAPDCARVTIDGIEYTQEEAESLDA